MGYSFTPGTVIVTIAAADIAGLSFNSQIVAPKTKSSIKGCVSGTSRFSLDICALIATLLLIPVIMKRATRKDLFE
jgi:hypothetical protein